MGVDKLTSISLGYPDLNMDWLISGEGEMLDSNMQHLVAHEAQSSYGETMANSVLNLTESNKILAESVRKAIDANIILMEKVLN